MMVGVACHRRWLGSTWRPPRCAPLRPGSPRCRARTHAQWHAVTPTHTHTPTHPHTKALAEAGSVLRMSSASGRHNPSSHTDCRCCWHLSVHRDAEVMRKRAAVWAAAGSTAHRKDGHRTPRHPHLRHTQRARRSAHCQRAASVGTAVRQPPPFANSTCHCLCPWRAARSPGPRTHVASVSAERHPTTGAC